VIVIDSDNYAEHGIETLFFPGGEPHVKVPADLAGDVLLFLKLRTWNDTGLAACLINALARNNRVKLLHPFIPYFPGARQDRTDGLAPLTIELMNRLLASDQPFIHVFDAHSDAVTDHMKWVNVLMPRDLNIPVHPGVVGIIAPDEGATQRAISFQTTFYPRSEFVQCSKRRDPVSGRLSGYHMPTLPKAGCYIIVDDICDGGGTFNLLAEEFGKDPLASQSYLEMFVSHGIFSKGLNAIDRRIKRITTTDSWCQIDPAHHSRLDVLPLNQLFPMIAGVRNA